MKYIMEKGDMKKVKNKTLHLHTVIYYLKKYNKVSTTICTKQKHVLSIKTS